MVTVKLLNSCDKTFVIKNAPCMHQHTRDVTYVVPLLFKETGSPDFKIFKSPNFQISGFPFLPLFLNAENVPG